MSQVKPQQGAPGDDIDLMNLLERMILYVRRFRIIFLVAAILGVSMGVFFYSISPDLYKSRIILHSSFLTNPEQIQIVDYWNELLKRREYNVLSGILNCEQEKLHQLASLDAADIQKMFTPDNPNGFYIDARVKDNSILPELQGAIVYGLNNTDYVKRKLAVRKENLSQLINTVTVEISKLDSTRAHIEKMISDKEKNGSSLMLDITGMNRELINMNEKLLGYKEELKFASGVQVLQGFVPLNTPVSISLKVLILVGLILCLSIAYVLTVIISVRGRLKKRGFTNA
jgi:hypothetical protein